MHTLRGVTIPSRGLQPRFAILSRLQGMRAFLFCASMSSLEKGAICRLVAPKMVFSKSEVSLVGRAGSLPWHASKMLRYFLEDRLRSITFDLE